MDGKQYGEPDIEHARERIEAKRDEFVGGPEPGWERMEQAAHPAFQITYMARRSSWNNR